nr:MAG TPA: hypothetical protein [Bacteriophage sp.]
MINLNKNSRIFSVPIKPIIVPRKPENSAWPTRCVHIGTVTPAIDAQIIASINT